MLGNRLRRGGALLVALFGLFGLVTPPASAVTSAVFAFQGTMTLDAGLSYPCVGTNTPNLAKCPSIGVNSGKLVPVTVTGGNTRTITGFSSSVCVSAGVWNNNVINPAAPCSITNAGTGVVTGSCGLSIGLVTTSKTHSHFTGGPLLRITSKHWINVGPVLVITGSSDDNSMVVGNVWAIPIPTVGGTTVGNSCSSKTATQFQLSGVIAAVGAG